MHCNFACVALQCSLCLRIVIAPLSGASLVNFMLVFKLVDLCIHGKRPLDRTGRSRVREASEVGRRPVVFGARKRKAAKNEG